MLVSQTFPLNVRAAHVERRPASESHGQRQGMGNESLHRDESTSLEEASVGAQRTDLFGGTRRCAWKPLPFKKSAPREQGEGQFDSQLLVPSPNPADLPCPQDLLLPRRSLLSGHTMVKQLQTPGSVYTASAF